jgi:hypothetical protein
MLAASSISREGRGKGKRSREERRSSGWEKWGW